jgi:glycosyltransferase involved in cell wall biosynthesis
MPRSYAQTFTPAMADAVARVGGKVDAMVALEIGTAVYCGGNGTRPRVPWIFEEAEGTIIHDQTASADGVLTQWRRQLTWRKYAAFVGRLIARAARTTVVSEVERHCLADAGCDQSRMSVLPNGVDEAYLAIDAPKQPDTLIYAGSLSYGPNLDAVRWFVTDILPRVRAVRPSVSLVVTGRHDGVPLAPLMREGVTFTGHVPDVASHVAGSAIAVVPLRIGGGTRLKVLEAMALGTPVVSTAKGAEGLDVRDQQHLLIADAPDAFARRVLDLLEQPARAREIAAHARQRIADRYTWRRIGLQLDALLRDAVRDHHAALRS